MTWKYSTAARNAKMDATGLNAYIGTSAKLRGYSGTRPANPAASITGTLLFELTCNATVFGAVSNGVLTAGAIAGANAGNNGLATHVRLVKADGTTVVGDGDVAQNWAASSPFTTGQQVVNGGKVYKATAGGTSAGSGGPTGTGSGITDGSVTWDYYAASADVVIANTNIAAPQPVSASSFAITEGNP